MKTPNFEIGYKFIQTRGKKRRDVETIIDILTTTNSKGEVVKIEYVATHEFMGQTVKATHIETTILMAEKVEPDPRQAILEAMDTVTYGIDALVIEGRELLDRYKFSESEERFEKRKKRNPITWGNITKLIIKQDEQR